MPIDAPTLAPCDTPLSPRALRLVEWVGVDRRGSQRSDVEYRLRLVPLDGIGASRAEQAEHFITAKDLSTRGVGLIHSQPLPYRLVRLTAADPRLKELGLNDLQIDVVLKWCRFIAPGRYESGGRIARSVLPIVSSVA